MSQDRDKEKQVISLSEQGEWIEYWEATDSGERELELLERYVILLVLDGEIKLTFYKNNCKTIGKKSLVVVDRQQLTNFKWAAGTAMLKFTPPEKIFPFFASCSVAFRVPCSTIVPVLPPLQEWVSDLLAELLKTKEELDGECRRRYCTRLSDILLNRYPPLLVGELLVAFRACSMSGGKKCRGEHTKNSCG